MDFLFELNRFRTDSQANEFLTTLSLTVFTQRNFVADFLQAKSDFTRKKDRFAFLSPLPPLRGFTVMYNDHLRLIGKRVWTSY